MPIAKTARPLLLTALLLAAPAVAQDQTAPETAVPETMAPETVVPETAAPAPMPEPIPAGPAAPAPDPALAAKYATDVVLMQGLDKITARISSFEAPVAQTVRFGTLDITSRRCITAPPTEPPESAAFLEIDDRPPDVQAKRLFTGWMFASSPALSAIEHPVYDVWVVGCRTSGQ